MKCLKSPSPPLTACIRKKLHNNKEMKPWQLLVLGILVGLLSAGLILLIALPERGKPITLNVSNSPVEIATKSDSTSVDLITIHLAGEINNPGLYTLPSGSRLVDAINTAAGLTAKASEKDLNLALELEDGQRYYIPSHELELETDSANQNTNQLININTASLDELMELPEIGEAKATAIIDYRSQNGAFLNIESLINVPGIGQSIYEKIKDLITIGEK